MNNEKLELEFSLE